MLRYGYNTNGMAHHRLEDAVDLLADLGYAGIALTLDVQLLDPFTTGPEERARARALLDSKGLDRVVETGARFLLDPRTKHRPTLLEDDPDLRERRIGFLRAALEMASDLEAGVVSFWSGVLPAGVKEEDAWDRLEQSVALLNPDAERLGVQLALEPEPGMLVETMDHWRAVAEGLGGAIGLCLDVGHLVVNGEGSASGVIQRHADDLCHVHLEDMANGVHEHLVPGEGLGNVDFEDVLGALTRCGYGGLVSLELSRDSHRAPEVAGRAIPFLQSVENGLTSPAA
jgi:sugar phosphate isomerase/epimerase